MKVKQNVIMGLDPSLSNTGIVIIENSSGILRYKNTITFTPMDKKKFLRKLVEDKIIPTDNLKAIPSKVERDNINAKWHSYRLENITHSLAELIKKFDVDTIVVEKQVRNTDLIAIIGAIRNSLGLNLEIDLYELEPTRWKKMLTDSGYPDEKLLRNFVANYYPLYEKEFNEHEVDAYCVILALARELKFPIKSIHGDGQTELNKRVLELNKTIKRR